LGPQQGAVIAAFATVIPQPKPAGNTSTSASNAKTAFTATNLFLRRIFLNLGNPAASVRAPGLCICPRSEHAEHAIAAEITIFLVYCSAS